MAKIFLGFILSLFLVSTISASNHGNGMHKHMDAKKSCMMKNEKNHKCTDKCDYKKEMKSHCKIDAKKSMCKCQEGEKCTCKVDGKAKCDCKKQMKKEYKCDGSCDYKKKMKQDTSMDKKAAKCDCKNSGECTCKGNCKCSKK